MSEVINENINDQLRKLEIRKNIFRNLSIIFNSILIFVVLWNMFNFTAFIDLNKEGAWIILCAILSTGISHQADSKSLRLQKRQMGQKNIREKK